METVFVFEGHRIIVRKTFTKLQCLVDDQLVKETKGLREANADGDFEFTLTGTDGQEKNLKIVHKDAHLKEPLSTLQLFCDNVLVDEKKTL